MSTPTDDLSAEPTTGQTAAAIPTRVRASSTDHARISVAGPGEAVVTTAEIPTIAGGDTRRNTPRYANRRYRPTRRETAPVVLRVLVWLLALLCLIGGVGLIVEHSQPSWLGFLRATAPTPHPNTSNNQSVQTPAAAMSISSSSAKQVTYSLTVSNYAIVVSTTSPCYVELRNPASASQLAFASTIAPKTSPKTFSVNGSAALTLEAQATSIKIKHGTTILGTITSPKVAVTYTFQPASP